MADDNSIESLVLQRPNIHYWLALKQIPRLATHKKLALVKAVGLAQLFLLPSCDLVNFNLSQKQQMAITAPEWLKIEKIISLSSACQSEIIGFDDALYPDLLKEIYDPPLVLFVKGNSKLLGQPQIAIVGSRNSSVSGRDNAFHFAEQLAKQALVITSGLALGIDAAAHKGALNCRGATIAVVATGLDSVYPSRHKTLAKDIVANDGLILSEFPPGTPPKAGHFPRRNRIISGLSLGVLIVEATIKSGSLITARCAIEQNRDVFAIPSAIQNTQARGCHWLIKQGAKLVEEVADIVEELNIPRKSRLNLNINSIKEERTEKNINQDLFNDSLLASVGYEITPVDIVVSRSKLPTDVVLTRLTMLELRGLVSAVPGGYLRVN
ncbi:MAG: DNA processing protein [Alteromonadaceae bacterium]|jgi:DNA processing protein